MAKYRVQEMADGAWRIWARYQPFKGAATKSFIETVPREEVEAAALRLAGKVNDHRNAGKPGKDSVG